MNLTGVLLAIFMFFSMNGDPASVFDIQAPVADSVTISFVGDCAISTYQGGSSEGSLNWYAENYGADYFFQNVAEIFFSDDITVANCETVLSDSSLSSREKDEEEGFWFLGPASNAEIFSSSGVDVASVVNNHSRDYGSQGLSDTVDALESAGLDVLTSGKPVYIEKNGITVGILGAELWYGGAETSLYSTIDSMCENSDIQIIYVHGGTESLREPESWRVTAFRRLIDRGADLVVACHAHVLQPMEEYNGGVIVYGLGNFCFGGNRYPENRTAIYQCTITRTEDGFELESSIIPCYVYTGSSNNWQPTVMDEDDPNYRKILEFMAGERSSPV